jgi:beta-xylosidase
VIYRFLEPLENADTPTAMRAALFKQSYTNSLVREITDTANRYGLSAEDKYTLLAYHAVQAMLRTQEELYRVTTLQVTPFHLPVCPAKGAVVPKEED